MREDTALDELVPVYAPGVETGGMPREDEDEDDGPGYALGEFAEGNTEEVLLKLMTGAGGVLAEGPGAADELLAGESE